MLELQKLLTPLLRLKGLKLMNLEWYNFWLKSLLEMLDPLQ